MRLQDKVAIITGGAKGIGREAVEAFAREGAKVVIADFDMGAGQELALKINSTGAESMFCQVDVTDRTSVELMVKETLEKFARIDILVNNAGITKDNLIMRRKEEDWDTIHQKRIFIKHFLLGNLIYQGR